MPRKLLGTVIVGALIAFGPSTGGQERAGANASDLDIDDVLALWEKQTRATLSVDARFALVRRSPTFHEETRLDGWAKIVRPNKAALHLELAAAPDGSDGAKTLEHVICTGEKAYLYHHPTRQLFIYPQDIPNQPTSWQEGFLFLFDMREPVFRTKYRATLVKVTPRTFLIQVFPLGNLGAVNFSRADVVLERETCLPEFCRLSTRTRRTCRHSRSRRLCGTER